MPVSVPASASLSGSDRESRSSLVHDSVALAEIELCGELMIAASAAERAGEERLSPARIDEILRVALTTCRADARFPDGARALR